MRTTFDPVQSADTFERRGFGFEIVADFDWASALYAVDDRRDYGEVREVAVGSIAGKIFVVVFTKRGEALHIISLRRSNRKERDRYAQADPYAVDDDNPPLTDGQLATLRPASAVFTPEQLASLAAARLARSPDPSVEVRLRISRDALAAFKTEGPGWETRMRGVLEKAAPAKT